MIRYRLDRRAKLILIILLVFCAALFKIDWDKGIIHTGGRAVLSQLLSSMFRPEISMELIQRATFATWQTFSYALISILISICRRSGKEMQAEALQSSLSHCHRHSTT